MNELRVNGTVKFMGINIPVIEGGFSEEGKVVSAKTISEIHKMELKEINQSIKRIIEKNRIKENVDYIDLFSDEKLKVTASDLGLITSNGQRNAFILSERGYTKLIKYMDDDKSWEVMDDFVDNYFSMRNVIQTVLSKRTLAIAGIVDAKTDIARAIAISNFENVVSLPLITTIEEQKPIVALAKLRIDKQGCYSLTDATKTLHLKKGQITRWAKAKEYIHKTIQEVNIAGEKFFKVYSTDGKYKNIGIKEDGLQEINNRLEEIKTY